LCPEKAKVFKDTSLPQNTVAKTTSETASDVSDKLKDRVLSFGVLLPVVKAQILVMSHKCLSAYLLATLSLRVKRTSALAPACRRDWRVKCKMNFCKSVKGKRKVIPLQARCGPEGG
jgi:hypothetical protein